MHENKFFHLVDTVMTLEPILTEKDLCFEAERDELVEDLWKQIKKRIDTFGEGETRLALSFLAVAMQRTIKYAIEPEDFHIVIENINKYLENELTKKG